MTDNENMVFVVDDDPSVLKALKRSLLFRGYNVQVFVCAQEFLEGYLGQRGCLVLDVRMPGMSGLELQSELIKLKINLPVIFITGHGGTPEAEQALKAGATCFLEKPFLPEKLVSCIDKALAG